MDWRLLEPHPAANDFPMMDGSRFEELCLDIKEHGVTSPILIYEDKIIDGRNRHRACVKLDIAPSTRNADLSAHGNNPYSFVWSLNCMRRDLTEMQRGAISKIVQGHSDDWQRREQERQAEIADAANRARAEAAKGNDNAALDRQEKTVVDHVELPLFDDRNKGRAARAKEVNVSTATMARVDTLANNRPDLLQKVASGEIKGTEAMRQMKADQVKEKVAALPDEKYRVIYADPPWQYNDSRAMDGYSGTAAADHYPTMPTSEICAMQIAEIAAQDAVLFCWGTFPLLPDLLEVIRSWGFKYKTAFIWSKGKPNFGHYHRADAEILAIATRGSCVPDAKDRQWQVQNVIREGRHSHKPEAFRELIDSMYQHGKKIELFSRDEAAEGWEVWGNESK